MRVCRHKKAKTDMLYSFSSYLYFSDLWWFLCKMEKWSDKPKIKLFSSDFLLFLYYFFNIYLLVRKRCFTFAAVNTLVMIYKIAIVQRNSSALYLLISNIIAAHIHGVRYSFLSKAMRMYNISQHEIHKGIWLISPNCFHHFDDIYFNVN